jgi:hypothetical protein
MSEIRSLVSDVAILTLVSLLLTSSDVNLNTHTHIYIDIHIYIYEITKLDNFVVFDYIATNDRVISE